MAEDYYKILEVARDASPEEIQKAYRRLARKYHPDLHEDDKQKEKAKQRFQQIQAAYDVLSEPEKRQMYDRFGENYQSMPGGSPFGASGPGGMEIDLSQLFGGGGGSFEQIFRHFGGGAAQAGQPRRGRPASEPAPNLDLVEEITVPFAVAVSGGEHRLTFNRNGKSETLSVKIPRGFESGKKIRLRKQGRSGPQGQTGDLLITVNVAPHPYYSRSGMNLQAKLPVTLAEAIRGTKVDLPTPHGTITVTVPAGSSNGRVLRLKGMGVHADDGSKGDLLAEVDVVIPDELSEIQKSNLLAALDSLPKTNPRRNLAW